jgi:hypothetical protein
MQGAFECSRRETIWHLAFENLPFHRPYMPNEYMPNAKLVHMNCWKSIFQNNPLTPKASCTRMVAHPKTEGTRPQAEISPSEEYSIGHPAQAW